jgi:hypothetical protein
VIFASIHSLREGAKEVVMFSSVPIMLTISRSDTIPMALKAIATGMSLKSKNGLLIYLFNEKNSASTYLNKAKLLQIVFAFVDNYVSTLERSRNTAGTVAGQFSFIYFNNYAVLCHLLLHQNHLITTFYYTYF